MAVSHPQHLLDLGATYEQLAFLQTMKVTAASGRKLWQQWSEFTDDDAYRDSTPNQLREETYP